MVIHSFCSYSLFVLALVALTFCQADQQIKPNSATVARRASAPTIRPSIKVDKIRDVEAVDPGLLSPPSAAKNSTGTRSVTDTLGKQSNTGSSQGTLLGQETIFGNPIFKNAFGGANNFNQQDNGFQQFSPGQPVGGFGQQGQVGGFGQTPGTFNQPGIGGFPNNNGGVFPGGGVLPGGSQLPPGSVAADSVAFSAARASDFTRVGVTQVRFDYTLTDIGYGWYPDRSEFVCYYPGLYYFTYHGLSTQTRQFK